MLSQSSETHPGERGGWRWSGFCVAQLGRLPADSEWSNWYFYTMTRLCAATLRFAGKFERQWLWIRVVRTSRFLQRAYKLHWVQFCLVNLWFAPDHQLRSAWNADPVREKYWKYWVSRRHRICRVPLRRLPLWGGFDWSPALIDLKPTKSY